MKARVRFKESLEHFLKVNRTPLSENHLSESDLLMLGQEFLDFYQTHSVERVDRFVTHARENYAGVILPIPRKQMRPELDYKSAYASYEILSGFTFFHELDVDGFAAPVVFASNSYCLENGKITSALGLQTFSPTVELPLRPSGRTWIASNGSLCKSEISSIDYFDRSQVLNEAVFLEDIGPYHPLSMMFPRVFRLAIGKVIVELSREFIQGRQLTNNDFGNLQIIQCFHSTCLSFSRHGLYHNDLRPWNLLYDYSSVHFVDFADISQRDQDVSGLPQVVAYIATLLVLMGKLTVTPEQFEATALEIVDVRLHHGLWSDLWRQLPSQPSFASLMQMGSPREIAYALLGEFELEI
jgi:hypothetical protein